MSMFLDQTAGKGILRECLQSTSSTNKFGHIAENYNNDLLRGWHVAKVMLGMVKNRGDSERSTMK